MAPRLPVLLKFVCLILISESISESSDSLKATEITAPLSKNGSVSVTPDVVKLNSSLDSSMDQDEKDSTCRLNVSSEAVIEFAEVLSTSGGAVFVTCTLHFANNSEHIYTNATNIVNPHNFLWALDGKGELLLTYPKDFEQLSLTTLSPGVYNDFTLDVKRPTNGCFERASDSDREFIQASFVVDVARAAIESLTVNQDLYADIGFRVCLRKSSDGSALTNDLLTILLSNNAEHHCLSVNASLELASPHFHPIKPEAWLSLLRYVGFIGAFFTPLCGLLFTHGKLPLIKPRQNKTHSLGLHASTETGQNEGVKYVALNSIIPSGIRHTLLYSYPNANTIFFIRCTVAIVSISYMPAWYVQKYTYIGHWDVTSFANSTHDVFLDSRSSVLTLCIVTSFMFSSFLLLLLHVFGSDEPRHTIHRMLDFNDGDLQRLTIVPWVTIQRRRPIPPLEGTTVKRFLLQLRARAWMALDPSIWREWPMSLLLHLNKGTLSREQIEAKLKSRYIWGFFVKLSLWTLLVPLLISSSFPIVNLFTPAVIETLRLIQRREKLSITGGLGILFFGVGTIMVFSTSTLFFVRLVKILAYTFIGVLLNHSSVGKVAIALTIIVVFIISRCSTFSSKYYILLKKLIDKAQEIEQDHQEKGAEDHPSCVSNTNELNDELLTSECEGKENPINVSQEKNVTERLTTSETNGDNNHPVDQRLHSDGSMTLKFEEDRCVDNNSNYEPGQDSGLLSKKFSPFIPDNNMDEENARIQSSHHESFSSGKHADSLIYLKGNVPHVSLHLYNTCVEEYLPVYKEFTKLTLQFALLTTLITLGVQSLKSIEDINEIPEVADYFLIAAIPAVIPLFESLLCSGARMEAEEEVKWRTLGPFLEEYRKQLSHDTQEYADDICTINSNDAC